MDSKCQSVLTRGDESVEGATYPRMEGEIDESYLARLVSGVGFVAYFAQRLNVDQEEVGQHYGTTGSEGGLYHGSLSVSPFFQFHCQVSSLLSEEGRKEGREEEGKK